MSFLDKVRKRGTTALGVAAVASGVALSASKHDELMSRSAAFAAEIHQAGRAALRGEHATTYAIETPDGPVTFRLNQTDEGADRWAEEMMVRGNLETTERSNSFSRTDLAAFGHALEQVSSTQAGMEVLSRVARTSNGEVQVLAAPDLEGTAVARNRFIEDENGGFQMRDPSDVGIHIGYDPKAVDKNGISSLGYIGADGKLHRATLDRIIVHELRHAAVRDDSAGHHDHGDGQTFTYDIDGHVTDLAMDSGNRHRREILGVAPHESHGSDRVYYQKVDLSLGQENFKGMRELTDVVARDEGVSWSMKPGYSTDRAFPPTAATLGVLKLNDREYLKHVREFAKDVAVEASMLGGGVPDARWAEAVSKETTPKNIIKMTEPFVQRASNTARSMGAKEPLDVVDMKHHVEVAGLVASYRESSQKIAANAGNLPIDNFGEVVRSDPQEALKIYNSELRMSNRAGVNSPLAKDALSESGADAQISKFMTRYDDVRRTRAKERLAPYEANADKHDAIEAQYVYARPLYETGGRQGIIQEVKAAQKRISDAQSYQAKFDSSSSSEPQKRIAISLGKPKPQATSVQVGSEGIAPKAQSKSTSVDADRIERIRSKARELHDHRHKDRLRKSPARKGNEAR